MEKKKQEIKIHEIPNSPRYLYTVDYIFTNPYATVAAFEKINENPGFHIQEFYELCLISKGEGYHVIEDTVVKAVRGDVFIVPPGRKHAFVGGNGFNVYYIHLAPAFWDRHAPRLKALPAFFALFEIEPLMRANGAKYRHLYLEEAAFKETLDILDIASKKWQHDEESQLIQESYITVVLTILCREYAKLQTIVDKNAHIDRLFMESIALILDRCNEKLTINQLAQVAGLSRTTYIKRFSEAIGMTPRQYIMEHRIKSAQNLLKNTDKPIVKIAEDTGFYDTAHFSKCFSDAVGVSPTEYRKKADNS